MTFFGGVSAKRFLLLTTAFCLLAHFHSFFSSLVERGKIMKVLLLASLLCWTSCVSAFSIPVTKQAVTTTSTSLYAEANGANVPSSKKVIVLGGDGFCGWPTCLYLSDQGHDVIMVDNLSRRNIDIELGCDSLTPIQSPDVSMQCSDPCKQLSSSPPSSYWYLCFMRGGHRSSWKYTVTKINALVCILSFFLDRFDAKHGRKWVASKFPSSTWMWPRSMIY